MEAEAASAEQRLGERFWAMPKITATFVPDVGNDAGQKASLGPFPVLDLSTNGCSFAARQGSRCNPETKGTLTLEAGAVSLEVRDAVVARTWPTGIAVAYPPGNRPDAVGQWFGGHRKESITRRSKTFSYTKQLASQDMSLLDAETQRLKNAGAVAFGIVITIFSGIAVFVATIPYLQAAQQWTHILGMAFVGLSIMAMGVELGRINSLNKTEAFVLLLNQQVAADSFRKNYRGWHSAMAALDNCRSIRGCPHIPSCVRWATAEVQQNRRSLGGASEGWTISRVGYLLCFTTALALGLISRLRGTGLAMKKDSSASLPVFAC